MTQIQPTGEWCVLLKRDVVDKRRDRSGKFHRTCASQVKRCMSWLMSRRDAYRAYSKLTEGVGLDL